MKKKELALHNLKVESFVTNLGSRVSRTAIAGFERQRSIQLGVCGTCSQGPCCETGQATVGETCDENCTFTAFC